MKRRLKPAATNIMVELRRLKPAATSIMVELRRLKPAATRAGEIFDNTKFVSGRLNECKTALCYLFGRHR